jgi:predicted metal-binding membrane protein
MSADEALETVLRRDRLAIMTSLAAVVALSWVYVLSGAGMGMSAFEMTRMPRPGPAAAMSDSIAMMMPVWTPGHAALMFFMWWVMMVAMMLPSAAPMLLLFATVDRRRCEAARPHFATSLFALGYLVAWAGFSGVAVCFQFGLQLTGLLSPMLVGTHAIFGGVVLLAAGLYQLTPLKRACLRQCRSPLEFLCKHWQRGPLGALSMGLVHGAFCVGCCWFLMGLLFVGGVMNLYWKAGVALFAWGVAMLAPTF